MAKDPVCGMIVNEKTGLYSEFGGKKFYFCSPVCQKTFTEPEKELSKMKKRMYVAVSGALILAIFRTGLYLGLAAGAVVWPRPVIQGADMCLDRLLPGFDQYNRRVEIGAGRTA